MPLVAAQWLELGWTVPKGQLCELALSGHRVRTSHSRCTTSEGDDFAHSRLQRTELCVSASMNSRKALLTFGV